MALPDLPIDPLLPQVLASLRRCPNLVLTAPPGAGKTTRVPPALVRAGLVPGSLVLLQPRRLAARAAARRIAEEQGWGLGAEVGYHVRFDRRLGPTTRIKVVTEGILVRMIQADPLLDGVDAVLLDELHLRSLETDLCLALLREVQREVRPEIRLLAMSATLAPGPVAAFLGDCPTFQAESATHPLEIEFAKGDGTPAQLTERVTATIARAIREGPASGDILVFLPGAREIRRVAAALPEDPRIEVLPLHGQLPADAQDRALQPRRERQRRRLLLSTNVAETSVTIDGVTTVIDSGLVRMPRHDPHLGLDRLELVSISHDSADQRAGRAGRTAAGRVYRLWSRARHAHLARRGTPEITRLDLSRLVLELCAWGTTPAGVHWLDPPPPAALQRAERLLRRLGALEGEGRLTALGRQLRELPLHPRLGRLLIEAHRSGLPDEGALLAALLSERELLRLRLGTARVTRAERPTGRSDLLERLELMTMARSGGFAPGRVDPDLDLGAARAVDRAARQLRRLIDAALGSAAKRPSDPEQSLLRAIFVAFADRVVRLRPVPPDEAHQGLSGRRGLMVGGRGVVLDPHSVVREDDLLVGVAIDDAGSEARVLLASAIQREWLAQRQEQSLMFDEASERVVATCRTLYQDLCLEEQPLSPDPERASEVLAQAAARNLAAAMAPGPEVEQLRRRVALLRREMPELDLPALDDDALVALLPGLCHGRRSFDELRRLDLAPWLRQRLTYHQQEHLERHAPERICVPSGSRIRLDYQPDGPPVLAVQLQQMFGLAETPRVAGGRLPVLLHLLGPNQRPVQVTQDLRSFWDRTYPEVRKELRRRYPKHAWPEDPWSAPPERRPRRRGKSG